LDKLVFFANSVPWNMHTHHSEYLADSFQKKGYKTKSYSCGGGQNYCYQKLINRRPLECLLCKLRSLNKSNKFSEKTNYYPINIIDTESLITDTPIISSVGSALRLENDNDIGELKYDNLKNNVKKEFLGLLKYWEDELKKFRPELFVIFNGRFHDTAAIVEACIKTDTKFICHERSWFGTGIYISFFENCISLENKKKMLHCHIDKPLNHSQCKRAYSQIMKRFRGTNNFEWRKYGQKLNLSSSGTWPIETKRKKILLMPSSRSEFFGNDSFKLNSENSIQAYSKVINKYFSKNSSIVVRAHPGWNRKIGHFKKSKSYDVYKRWAQENNFYFIEPESNFSSYELMKKSDYVIMNGGSSVVEANVLGCNVITVSPSLYSDLPIVTDMSKDSFMREKIPVIDKKLQFIYSLRYLHYLSFDMPFFYNSILPKSPKSNDFVYDKTYQISEIDRIMKTLDSVKKIKLVKKFNYKLSECEEAFYKEVSNK